MAFTYDPLAVALEVREQLASEKRRLAFFSGAGISMATGIPGIDELTKTVYEKLKSPYKEQYKNIADELAKNANVENVLDRVRLIREYIGTSEEKEMDGIKGATNARQLDVIICTAICEIVSSHPSKGLNYHLVFAHWIRALYGHRDYPVEIFTTNYDLLLETAMEQIGLPFFDGFVGSVNPFFTPESVEADIDKKYEDIYPPKAWTRLWKMHGSINWFMSKKTDKFPERITRSSGSQSKDKEELVIFPSREKYMQSRKLPFIAFQDRLRTFLSSGESLMIIIGYGFEDDHLNEVIFQSLRSNPRLAVTAFIYGDSIEGGAKSMPQKIIDFGIDHKNLSLYGPDKACVGGVVAPWGEPSRKRKENELWPFWDEKSKQFTLWDFSSLAKFLETFIGFKFPAISSESEADASESVTSIKKE